MVALVHIGPHKTASTSIQRLLASFSSVLNDRGWSVPVPPVADAVGTASLNHVALEMLGCQVHPWHAWEVVPGLMHLRKWLTAVPGSPILSAEEFSRFDEYLIARLAAMCGSDAVCLIGARPYDELSESLWAQLVGAGVVADRLDVFQWKMLRAFQSEAPLQVPDRALVDLAGMRLTNLIQRWGKFMDVRLVAVPKPCGDGGRELLRRFLIAGGMRGAAAYGLSGGLEGASDASWENRRLPLRTTLAVLQFNRVVGTETPAKWAQSRALVRLEPTTMSLDTAEGRPSTHAASHLRELYLSDLSTMPTGGLGQGFGLPRPTS